MHNPVIDEMEEYAFDRLRALLKGIDPPDGIEPLMMSLGEPQHAPPSIIGEAVQAQINNWGHYPPTAGASDHLVAAANWLQRRYDLPDGMIDPETTICAAMGSRESLYMIGDVCIPRSKNGFWPVVLVPNPFYQAYYGAARLNGADPLLMSGTTDNGFLPAIGMIDPKSLERTVLAYICAPTNPQGRAASIEYFIRAIELAREYDFVLAVDECYAEIYTGSPSSGVMQACAELGGSLNNVLSFNSLSKRSSAPGLRSGFVAGDPELIKRLKRLRAYGGATIPAPLAAAATALWNDDAHVEENRALYREKFDAADKILGDKLGYYRPDGGFFLWLNVGDDERATVTLWRDAGVKVIPGSYLGLPDANGVNPGAGYIRVALVDTTEKVADGLTRIANTLN